MREIKMKKLMACLLAVGMTASIAGAQEVLSRNAVGYVKQEIAGGKLFLVSQPFVNLETGLDSHSLTNVLNAVPGGTIVSIWNQNAQSYVNFSRTARGVWDGAAQTSLVSRGQAMFLRIPVGAGTNEVVFMGEVPDKDNAPLTPQSRVPGLSFVGYPYPASIAFTSAVMAVELPGGAIASRWDAALQTYVNYSKTARGVWDGAAQAATINAGDAFIIRSTATANNWDEIKPYTWP
jgi:hypothetical protein